MSLLKSRKVFPPNFASLPLGVFALNILLIFVGSAASALAATPAEYKLRVESARIGVEELLQNLDSADDDWKRRTFSEIESDVPASERIEWPGGSVETQNGWLATKLKEFSNFRGEKYQREILIEISERLLAIAESVDALDKAVAERTKDQDKQKLAEILGREEYQKSEAKEESLFQKWWRQFMDWLGKAFPRPDIQPGTPTGLGSFQFALQVLIFALVIAFLGFILYKFAPHLFARFGTKSKKKKEARVILGERIGDDESASDLFTEAEQLAREGNLRGAIRKGYIALLCDLGDRKIVRLARHKTNRDYLRDVRRNESLSESMRGVTLNFETNWYGLRHAEQADWEDFRSKYKQTVAAAGSTR